MSTIPWTYDPRPDTRTSSVRLAVWLFLASEAMLFASLLSGYVLLRSGSASWPNAAALLDGPRALGHTVLLALATMASVWLPRRGGGLPRTTPLVAGAALAAVFVAAKIVEYQAKLAAGLGPSANLLLACWFTLTAVHAAHVLAGAVANLWLATRRDSTPRQAAERFAALGLYWGLIDLVWLALLIGFYAF
jgi:heme/copper-type cytochrome/quinol oxidase subunit 3